MPNALFFLLLWLLVYWLTITFLSPNVDAVDYIERFFGRRTAGKTTTTITWDGNSPQNVKVRADLIYNVRHSWVEPVLNHALHDTVRITLNLEYDTAVLARPMQRREGSRRWPVPSGKPIEELFAESSRTLLILGAPGSGKTYTLVELCQKLLDAAEKDTDEPVPAVLNLATWAEEKQPLHDWLVERMFQEYQISRTVTPAWLAAGQLCPLLDGLDEVREEAQEDCINAINAFRQAYPLPLTVCSREQDYEKLSRRLNLTTAVAIQPLSQAQITGYLMHPKLQLYAVHDAIQEDALQELTQTPLFLSIMALAYRGLSLNDLRPLLSDTKQRQRHLYNTYICRMFARPRENVPADQYPPRQSLGRLAYLARQLTQRNQYQFFFEDLQPDWLTETAARRFRLIDELVFGPIFGLIAGLIIVLVIGLSVTLLVGLFFGLFFGLIFAIGGVLFVYERNIEPVEELSLHRPTVEELATVANWGLTSGVLFGLIGGLRFGLIVGIVVGLIVGIVVGLIVGLVTLFEKILLPAPSRLRERPNQGIARSARNALLIGLGDGPIVWLVLGLVAGLLFGSVVGLVVGMFCWLVVGLGTGLFRYGGADYIGHHLLRWRLSREGLLPYRLQAFLDAMDSRVLLQSTGPSYHFFHRTLQEHFAVMTETDIAQLAQEIETDVR